MIWFLLYFKQICDKFVRDEMSVYAAQASFFIVLAAFPFLMVLLSLIQLVPIVNESDLMVFLVTVVPDNLHGLVLKIVDSVYLRAPGTVLSLTGLLALWSASKGMLGVERGLNRIYGIEVERNWIYRRIVCSFYTVLFTLMCLLSMILLVFGNLLQVQLFKWVPGLSRFSFLIEPGRTVGFLVVLFFFFLGIYVVLPFKKQRIRSQIAGAFFCAVGWFLFSMAFSVYFKYFGNYALMYGSLTAAVLFLLWLYFGICILFFGGEINCFLAGKEYEAG